MAKKQKTKAIRVDATGVEKAVRQRGKRIPEADYLFKIVDCEKRKKEGGTTSYLSWKVQIIEDSRGKKKHAGVPFWYITSLKPEALFNLRNFIFAATDGKTNIAGKVVSIDPTKYFGKKIGGTVEDEEYEKKIRSKLVDVFPPSQLEAEEEDESDEEAEEEEDEGEEDEDEDEDDDDTEDEDEDDLEDVDDEDL